VLYGSIFFVADCTGCWNAYRLQPKHVLSWEEVSQQAKQVVFLFCILVVPVNLAMAVFAPPKELPVEPPTVARFVGEITLLLIIMDTGYFWAHWCMHRSKTCFRYVHALHHEVTATNVWAAQYLTIWEYIVVAVLSAVPPVLLGSHPLIAWVWQGLSVVLSLDGHCGYELPFHPFAPLVNLGILGGASHHDLHHLRPNYNMAPFLTVWDRLVGTFSDGSELRPDQFLHGKRRTE
jgi:cholesterol 25-hydroxylase